MTPGPGIEPETHWWEASALTTTPSLLPEEDRTVLSRLNNYYIVCIFNKFTVIIFYILYRGRRGGLMVSALDSGASGPGSSPRRGHCVVFLGKTLYSHSASLHPGV